MRANYLYVCQESCFNYYPQTDKPPESKTRSLRWLLTNGLHWRKVKLLLSIYEDHFEIREFLSNSVKRCGSSLKYTIVNSNDLALRAFSSLLMTRMAPLLFCHYFNLPSDALLPYSLFASVKFLDANVENLHRVVVVGTQGRTPAFFCVNNAKLTIVYDRINDPLMQLDLSKVVAIDLENGILKIQFRGRACGFAEAEIDGFKLDLQPANNGNMHDLIIDLSLKASCRQQAWSSTAQAIGLQNSPAFVDLVSGTLCVSVEESPAKRTHDEMEFSQPDIEYMSTHTVRFYPHQRLSIFRASPTLMRYLTPIRRMPAQVPQNGFRSRVPRI